MVRVISFLFSLFLAFGVQGQIAVALEKPSAHNVFGEPVAIGNSYDVVDFKVDVNMKDQVADVVVTQRIKNATHRDMEVEIFFPLPNNGIVQNLSMMVNGQEIPGKLMEKDKARQIYEGIVRQKKDPALMEYVGYGMFKTSVFPMRVGEERDITIRYTQLCEMNNDQVAFVYPLGTQKFSSKPLRNCSFNLRIKSSKALKNIFSPSDEVEVKRISDTDVSVRYSKQMHTPQHDFKLTFGVQKGKVGAAVLSYKPEEGQDGYFMLLASPGMEQQEDETRKNVVFVIDRSGSMAGAKMEQSKAALKFVISNLRDGDRFNIIDYDDRVEMYKNELQVANSESKAQALNYASAITDAGGTNINDALVTALSMLQDDNRPNYILFLTDGLPTSGVTDEMEIATNVKTANTHNSRIFAFGVGNDVNARLLDRLTSENGGLSEYVKPHENVEASVSKLYKSISSPVMSNITVQFSNTDVRSSYPDRLPDLFKGGQLIWVGKYNKPGKNKLTIKGKVGGDEKTYSFDIDLADHKAPPTYDYVEKIWASRRVGYLIGQIDMNGRQPELVNELVKLSKQYGILTPFTAFLAREDVDLANQSQLESESIKELEVLDQVQGAVANEVRMQKKALSMSVESDEEVMVKDYRGEEKEVQTVKKVGVKTFYRRGSHWVDGSIGSHDKGSVIEITQFSDDYFTLAKGQSAEFNKYLSLGETILVQLDNKIYRIIK